MDSGARSKIAAARCMRWRMHSVLTLLFVPTGPGLGDARLCGWCGVLCVCLPALVMTCLLSQMLMRWGEMLACTIDPLACMPPTTSVCHLRECVCVFLIMC